MNLKKLKPLFMGLVVPLLVVLAGLDSYQIYSIGITAANLASLFSILPLIIFLILIINTQNIAGNSAILTIVGAIIMFGIVVSVGDSLHSQRSFNNRLLPPLLASLGGVIFVLYSFWYSKLNRVTSDNIDVGSKLAAFSLSNTKGEVVNSTEFLGRSTVVIFYRGVWCPFCVAQIKDVVDSYQKAIYDGIRFVLVSPQPDKVTQKMAEKFDVPFLFLTDKNNIVAKQLSIVDDNGLPLGLSEQGQAGATVYPTVVVTDELGTIVYSHQTNNFRVRPNSGDYLELLIAH